MFAVSVAATKHVSALQALGRRRCRMARCGYAMRWCSRIEEVLCVMCARVMLGSMAVAVAVVAGLGLMLGSFHFVGRKSFQLSVQANVR
jgi:hypothetical protein